MRVVENILILTKREKQISILLCQEKSQAEVARELNFSRSYINQTTKKLESFGAISSVNIPFIHIKRYKENQIKLKIIEDVDIKRKRSKNGKHKIHYKFCKICKSTFKTENKYKKYCSPYCHGISKSGPRSPNWKGGKKFEPYCWRFNEEFKERVREFFGRVCFACGEKEDPNKRLSVHHVEYDKMACCDDNSDPLFVPLCETCHNITSRMKNREFLERLFYNQLIERTGGKCYISQKEMLELIESKKETFNIPQTIS